MRKFRYIFALALSLSIVGCDNDNGDEWLTDSFDPTAPAMVLFQHSARAIVGASGLLVEALNLNEYILSPDEESRLALEDELYPYDKVREREGDLWAIYNQSAEDLYYLTDGEPLSEVGALWEMRKSRRFFYERAENKVAPTIESLGGDTYKVTMDECMMPFFTLQYDLTYYLRAWSSWAPSKTAVTLDLTIRTNNSAFRRGEAEELTFTISGSGKCRNGDMYVSSGNYYCVTFDIVEPVTFTFLTDAVMKSDCVGTGVMEIINDIIDVEATMSPLNVIAISITGGDSPKHKGYYDWTGANIRPEE